MLCRRSAKKTQQHRLHQNMFPVGFEAELRDVVDSKTELLEVREAEHPERARP